MNQKLCNCFVGIVIGWVGMSIYMQEKHNKIVGENLKELNKVIIDQKHRIEKLEKRQEYLVGKSDVLENRIMVHNEGFKNVTKILESYVIPQKGKK